MTRILETKRLILRNWKVEDHLPFARLNADSRVMEFFPATLSESESNTLLNLMMDRIVQNGFGFWATKLRITGEFIGFLGLNIPKQPLPFSPCVEIGWRLSYNHWGHGYAQEGALAALNFGFQQLGLREIVSFTSQSNLRSRNVMEKIGMHYDARGDFDHPGLKEGHPLRRHVLYRAQRFHD